MSTPEEKFLISLSRLRNLLFRDLDTLFHQHQLTTTQFSVLEVLYHKGDLCIKEIQNRILGTNGNIPLVIKNLERNGLIRRTKKENDNRYSVIQLTPEGKEKIQLVYPEQQKRLHLLLQDIPTQKLQELTEDLFAIYQAGSEHVHL